MSELKFKIKKIFDCLDMSEKVNDFFRSICRESEFSNNSYVDWVIGENDGSDTASAIDIWLVENGAANGENVLINLSW